MVVGIHACCTKSNLRTAVIDMIAAGKYEALQHST